MLFLNFPCSWVEIAVACCGRDDICTCIIRISSFLHSDGRQSIDSKEQTSERSAKQTDLETDTDRVTHSDAFECSNKPSQSNEPQQNCNTSTSMDVSETETFTATSSADQQLVPPLSQPLSQTQTQPEPEPQSQALFASSMQPEAQPQPAKEAAARGSNEHNQRESVSQSGRRESESECVVLSAFLVHLRHSLMRLCGVAADADGGTETETPLDLFDLPSLVGLLSALCSHSSPWAHCSLLSLNYWWVFLNIHYFRHTRLINSCTTDCL